MKKTLGIIFLILVISCQSDDLIEREFPRIQTVSIQIMSPNSVRVYGAITQNSTNTTIREYGVVWSGGAPNIFANKTVADNLNNNQFSVDVTDLPVNAFLNLRVYALTDSDVIYGDTIPFTLNN